MSQIQATKTPPLLNNGRLERQTVAATAGTGSSAVVESCQVCRHTDLETILFLGYLPPVNTMPTVGSRTEEQPSYPAQLLHCPKCRLVQLGLVVDPQILFPPSYPYTSGTTKILRENFAQLYAEVQDLYPLTADDLVVDVGSNDGTLLGNFARGGRRVHGIEPTNACKIAQKNGVKTLNSFFNSDAVQQVVAKSGHANLVTAANVFAHIENIHDVVKNIVQLLSPNGVFINESHYLVSLLETVQYDTIYHEHLRYYSLTSLQSLFQMHGLEIIHARRIPTHGGSIRVYAARIGTHPVRESVAQILELENKQISSEAFSQFRTNVVRSKLGLLSLLNELKQKDTKIYGIGAPSRASTLINYVGIDEGIIDSVLEISGSYKIGKYVPGTLIPVEDEARLFDDPPDYAVLFSWHIADELIPKLFERGYRGEFIVPLPTPRIVRCSTAT